MQEATKWNNKPRIMLCWNDNKAKAKKVKVVHIVKGSVDYPVVALLPESGAMQTFKHCNECDFKVGYFKHCADITDRNERG